MKNQNVISLIVAVSLPLWITGCEEKKADLGTQIKEEASKTGEAIKDAAGSLKESGEKVAKEVAEKAKEITAAGNSKVQELIDSAKSLAGEGKFQDALAKLKALGSENLSVEQKNFVEGLKVQIDKALAGGKKVATNVIDSTGNLLKK
ncbi:MAG: hypothetical protein HOP33_11605 [Verrucomicrobia bacterium]|nr:hypothetical protein [Verrucomicrobiota bacterium]